MLCHADAPWWNGWGSRLGWTRPAPPHGPGGGRSLGWRSRLGRTPSRSAADPRRHPVAPWTPPRRPTWRHGTRPPVPPVDIRDDRWAPGLEAWRHAPRWRAGAGALQPPRWRVNDVPPAGGRRERTTASGPWRVTADGQCQEGPSHAPRPARPQGKGRIAAREPLGLPVAPDVVPGPRGAREPPAFLPTGGDSARGPGSEGQRAHAGARGGRPRLATAQAAVTARQRRGRGQRRGPDPRALRPAVAPRLSRDRGQGRLHVRDQARGGARPCGWRGTPRCPSAGTRRPWPRRCATGGGGSLAPPHLRRSARGRWRSWRPAASRWASGPGAACQAGRGRGRPGIGRERPRRPGGAAWCPSGCGG